MEQGLQKGSEQKKTPHERGFLVSRRPDSNRGPFITRLVQGVRDCPGASLSGRGNRMFELNLRGQSGTREVKVVRADVARACLPNEQRSPSTRWVRTDPAPAS